MNLNNIKNDLALAESQLTNFNTKGTASSATCARAHLLVISKQCNELRKQIMAESKQKKSTRAEAKRAKQAKPVVEEPDVVAVPEEKKL